jgi:hypothetical protein
MKKLIVGDKDMITDLKMKMKNIGLKVLKR